MPSFLCLTLLAERMAHKLHQEIIIPMLFLSIYHYIDPSSDDVELVGNMANHLVGLAGLTYGSTRTAASTL